MIQYIGAENRQRQVVLARDRSIHPSRTTLVPAQPDESRTSAPASAPASRSTRASTAGSTSFHFRTKTNHFTDTHVQTDIFRSCPISIRNNLLVCASRSRSGIQASEIGLDYPPFVAACRKRRPRIELVIRNQIIADREVIRRP